MNKNAFPWAEHLPELLAGLALLALLILAASWLVSLVGWLNGAGIRQTASRSLSGALLDVVLMAWGPDDVLTLKDLLNGGIVIFGRPGSGKSSSSSYQLMMSIVAYARSGGIILGASPDDLALCRRIFAGRMERLVVFDELSGHRLNAINFIMSCGGSTKDILAMIFAIAETIDRSGGGGKGGGDDGSFFTLGARRVIEHAIVIVKNATGHVNPTDLVEFINTAATSIVEVQSDAFKLTTHYVLLKSAYEKADSTVETSDCELARVFFMQELPRMADRTRTSLIAVVMNTLHVFVTGQNRLLFSSDTNISPKLVDESKWLFVNMPVSRCGFDGAFAIGVWRLLTQWYVMRRDPGKDNPPCIIHVDELHRTLNSYDSLFLGECRKFGGCMIACSQSKASFYATMPGDAAEAHVDALLNNFSHKIIHALGYIKTASWVSELVGSASQLSLGGSEQSPENIFAAWLGQGVWTGSFSEQIRPLAEARVFMHGFAREDTLTIFYVMRRLFDRGSHSAMAITSFGRLSANGERCDDKPSRKLQDRS